MTTGMDLPAIGEAAAMAVAISLCLALPIVFIGRLVGWIVDRNRPRRK